MTGIIRKINREATITYISSESKPFNIYAGAYLLYTSFQSFRKGTIFLVVIDPGVGTNRRALLVRTRHYYFVGPDNGVLYPSIQKDGLLAAYELTNPHIHLGPQISSTFHGRDVFAPAAAFKSLGVPDSSLGSPVDPFSLLRLEFTEEQRGDLRCGVVLFVDHFGNVATSITHLPELGDPIISINGVQHKAKKVRTFGEGLPGELIIYKNSYDFVELGINKGNANKVIDTREGESICLGGYTQGDFSRST
nr:SAM-dependent chlorinase/fluorinase [Sulfodiicoccus acidiphilus]